VILLLLLNPFNGLFFRTTWVSQHQKGKTSLDLNEARHDGVSGCTGISWTIYKQSTPRSRQITTPTPHHSITGRMLFWCPANSIKALKAIALGHFEVWVISSVLKGYSVGGISNAAVYCCVLLFIQCGMA